MGGSSKNVTVGYKYYLGIHMILCHGPIDALTKIEVDNKTAWTGSSTGGQITVNASELFGGESREGGVSGTIDVEMGSPSQSRNTYLQSILGSAIPAFRGVAGVVLRRVYIGLNPYLKRWAFWARRINKRQTGIDQWYLAKAAIGTDMNPAHIIRECLTDPDWGMGYPEADMDETAFQAAANQLYTENFGLSFLWDRSMELGEFIAIVLRHIDAALYMDRSSGKFVLKLARGGYSLVGLTTLDENSIQKISDFKRSTIAELTNSVTIVYSDSSTGNNNSVTVQDTALTARQGSTVGTTIQYPGIGNGTLASKVAYRDLKALSTPLASATFYVNRTAANLNVGDVFILSWSRYGITQLVMRVTNIELGQLDNNLIKLTAVEDVFSLGAAIYASPPATGWTNPISVPASCPYHSVIEAPYYELVQRLGDVDAQALDSTSGYVVSTGVRPSSDAINAKIYSNPTNTAYEEAGTVNFCPTATLNGSVTITSTVWAIANGIDLDLVTLGSYASIDNEIVSVVAVSSSSITVGRGVLDTVPASHSSGARLLFSDAYFETDNIEYVDGETARIKLLPITGLGMLPLGSATEQTVVMDQRQFRPYPPGLFKINTVAYPDSVAGDADIVVTWAHRDRLQQTATLIDTTASNIGPEAGTTYSIQLLTEAGSVISSATGLTGTTHTFTLAAMGANYGRLRIKLWSVRDSLDSRYSHDWLFTRAGYGTAYGYAYGGGV